MIEPDTANAEPFLQYATENKSIYTDMLNRDGARALARRLQRYWHDRGHPSVCFWAEAVDERFAKIGTHEIYRVASNLINGLPPS